jgi:hypothetical protein
MYRTSPTHYEVKTRTHPMLRPHTSKWVIYRATEMTPQSRPFWWPWGVSSHHNDAGHGRSQANLFRSVWKEATQGQWRTNTQRTIFLDDDTPSEPPRPIQPLPRPKCRGAPCRQWTQLPPSPRGLQRPALCWVDSFVDPRQTPLSPLRGPQRHCAKGLTGVALATRHLWHSISLICIIKLITSLRGKISC